MIASAVIKNARGTTGLSQRELAARSGTSQATICDYERGIKSPTAETLGRILAAAGYGLELTPLRTPVCRPSRGQLKARSLELLDVLELAAALPTAHSEELDFPALPRG